MKRSSPFLLVCTFAILAVFIFGSVRSTASRPTGSRPSIKTRQAVPSRLSETKSVVAKQKSAPTVDQSAWQQIQSLLQEKEARTPAQQKIDSQLLYAIKMRRGEKIATTVRSLSVEVGADDSGRVTVDISAKVDDEFLNDLR